MASYMMNYWYHPEFSNLFSFFCKRSSSMESASFKEDLWYWRIWVYEKRIKISNENIERELFLFFRKIYLWKIWIKGKYSWNMGKLERAENKKFIWFFPIIFNMRYSKVYSLHNILGWISTFCTNFLFLIIIRNLISNWRYHQF